MPINWGSWADKLPGIEREDYSKPYRDAYQEEITNAVKKEVLLANYLKNIEEKRKAEEEANLLKLRQIEGEALKNRPTATVAPAAQVSPTERMYQKMEQIQKTILEPKTQVPGAIPEYAPMTKEQADYLSPTIRTPQTVTTPVAQSTTEPTAGSPGVAYVGKGTKATPTLTRPTLSSVPTIEEQIWIEDQMVKRGVGLESLRDYRANVNKARAEEQAAQAEAATRQTAIIGQAASALLEMPDAQAKVAYPQYVKALKDVYGVDVNGLPSEFNRDFVAAIHSQVFGKDYYKSKKEASEVKEPKDEIIRLQNARLEQEQIASNPNAPEPIRVEARRKATEINNMISESISGRSKPAAVVNVNNKAESAGQVKLSEMLATDVTENIKAERDANQTLKKIAELRSLAAKVPVQGPLGKVYAEIAPLAASLGIKIDGASEAATFDTVVQNLILEAQKNMKGSVSDSENARLEKAAPSIGQSRQTLLENLAITEEIARAVAARGAKARQGIKEGKDLRSIHSGMYEEPKGQFSGRKMKREKFNKLNKASQNAFISGGGEVI